MDRGRAPNGIGHLMILFDEGKPVGLKNGYILIILLVLSI